MYEKGLYFLSKFMYNFYNWLMKMITSLDLMIHVLFFHIVHQDYNFFFFFWLKAFIEKMNLFVYRESRDLLQTLNVHMYI